MWRVALGFAVVLQAGAAIAADVDDESEPSGAPADCTSESAGEDCAGEEAVVPAAPPVTPAAPAAVAATAPTPAAYATVNFRNDVAKTLKLVEAQFTMDGEKLPVVLTSAEPGKSYVIVSRTVKPGPHIVSARLTYQGDRGVFSYMKGYKLNVRAEQVLTAPADRTVSFTVVGRESKGMMVPLDKRVVINVEEGARRK